MVTVRRRARLDPGPAFSNPHGRKWKNPLRRVAVRSAVESRQLDSPEPVSDSSDSFVDSRDASAEGAQVSEMYEVDSVVLGHPDDDDPPDVFDWLFDDDPGPPAPVIADPAVAAAFEDLLGDWVRSGRLTRGEVAMLAVTRGLSATQVSEVIRHLEAAGVELSDARTTAEIPLRPDDAGVPRRRFRDLDLLGRYLDEITQYSLLTPQREVELWALREDGLAAQQELDADGGSERPDAAQLRRRVDDGRRAWAELVCANLRLVVSIARHPRYDGCGVELADRIQAGNLGLLKAADKFDGSKGFKFSTYATWWIRQSIEREIANTGRTVRVPVHTLEKMGKVRRVARRLAQRLGREPTVEEIADATDLEPGAVAALLDLMRPVASLDALLGDEGDLRLSDVILTDDQRDGRTDPANIVIEVMHRAEIERIMRATLTEREATILQRRYGFHTGERETLDAIALDFGVTRERIRQIEARSINILRIERTLRAIHLGEVPSTQAADGRRAG